MEKNYRGSFNEQSLNFPAWNKKVKFTCLEGAEEAQRYSSTLSLTPAPDGGGWSTPCPVWTGMENLVPNDFRSPDRPFRN
jgi:hypothetical protein